MEFVKRLFFGPNLETPSSHTKQSSSFLAASSEEGENDDDSGLHSSISLDDSQDSPLGQGSSSSSSFETESSDFESESLELQRSTSTYSLQGPPIFYESAHSHSDSFFEVNLFRNNLLQKSKNRQGQREMAHFFQEQSLGGGSNFAPRSESDSSSYFMQDTFEISLKGAFAACNWGWAVLPLMSELLKFDISNSHRDDKNQTFLNKLQFTSPEPIDAKFNAIMEDQEIKEFFAKISEYLRTGATDVEKLADLYKMLVDVKPATRDKLQSIVLYTASLKNPMVLELWTDKEFRKWWQFRNDEPELAEELLRNNPRIQQQWQYLQNLGILLPHDQEFEALKQPLLKEIVNTANGEPDQNFLEVLFRIHSLSSSPIRQQMYIEKLDYHDRIRFEKLVRYGFIEKNELIAKAVKKPAHPVIHRYVFLLENPEIRRIIQGVESHPAIARLILGSDSGGVSTEYPDAFTSSDVNSFDIREKELFQTDDPLADLRKKRTQQQRKEIRLQLDPLDLQEYDLLEKALENADDEEVILEGQLFADLKTLEEEFEKEAKKMNISPEEIELHYIRKAKAEENTEKKLEEVRKKKKEAVKEYIGFLSKRFRIDNLKKLDLVEEKEEKKREALKKELRNFGFRMTNITITTSGPHTQKQMRMMIDMILPILISGGEVPEELLEQVDPALLRSVELELYRAMARQASVSRYGVKRAAPIWYPKGMSEDKARQLTAQVIQEFVDTEETSGTRFNLVLLVNVLEKLIAQVQLNFDKVEIPADLPPSAALKQINLISKLQKQGYSTATDIAEYNKLNQNSLDSRLIVNFFDYRKRLFSRLHPLISDLELSIDEAVTQYEAIFDLAQAGKSRIELLNTPHLDPTFVLRVLSEVEVPLDMPEDMEVEQAEKQVVFIQTVLRSIATKFDLPPLFVFSALKWFYHRQYLRMRLVAHDKKREKNQKEKEIRRKQRREMVDHFFRDVPQQYKSLPPIEQPENAPPIDNVEFLENEEDKFLRAQKQRQWQKRQVGETLDHFREQLDAQKKQPAFHKYFFGETGNEGNQKEGEEEEEGEEGEEGEDINEDPAKDSAVDSLGIPERAFHKRGEKSKQKDAEEAPSFLDDDKSPHSSEPERTSKLPNKFRRRHISELGQMNNRAMDIGSSGSDPLSARENEEGEEGEEEDSEFRREKEKVEQSNQGPGSQSEDSERRLLSKREKKLRDYGPMPKHERIVNLDKYQETQSHTIQIDEEVEDPRKRALHRMLSTLFGMSRMDRESQLQWRKMFKTLKAEGFLPETVPHRGPNPEYYAHFAKNSRRTISAMTSSNFIRALEWLAHHPDPNDQDLKDFMYMYRIELIELADMGVFDTVLNTASAARQRQSETVALAKDADFVLQFMQYLFNPVQHFYLKQQDPQFMAKVRTLRMANVANLDFLPLVRRHNPAALFQQFPQSMAIFSSDPRFLEDWQMVKHNPARLRVLMLYGQFRKKYRTLVREGLAPTPHALAHLYLLSKAPNFDAIDNDLLTSMWIEDRLARATIWICRGYSLSDSEDEDPPDDPRVRHINIQLNEDRKIPAKPLSVFRPEEKSDADSDDNDDEHHKRHNISKKKQNNKNEDHNRNRNLSEEEETEVDSTSESENNPWRDIFGRVLKPMPGRKKKKKKQRSKVPTFRDDQAVDNPQSIKNLKEDDLDVPLDLDNEFQENLHQWLNGKNASRLARNPDFFRKLNIYVYNISPGSLPPHMDWDAIQKEENEELLNELKVALENPENLESIRQNPRFRHFFEPDFDKFRGPRPLADPLSDYLLIHGWYRNALELIERSPNSEKAKKISESPRYLKHMREVARLGAFDEQYPKEVELLKNDQFFNNLEKLLEDPDNPRYRAFWKSKDFYTKVLLLIDAGFVPPIEARFSRDFNPWFLDDSDFLENARQFIDMDEPQRKRFLSKNKKFATQYSECKIFGIDL